MPVELPVLSLPGRHDEALAIAERGRTRAFADLLVERQKASQQAGNADPYIPVTVEHILETVNSQKAVVLYYSLAGGFLYSWLIAPGTGTHAHIGLVRTYGDIFYKRSFIFTIRPFIHTQSLPFFFCFAPFVLCAAFIYGTLCPKKQRINGSVIFRNSSA